jgi:exosome complex component RRP46
VKLRDEQLDRATIEVDFHPLSSTSSKILKTVNLTIAPKDRLLEQFLEQVADNVIYSQLHPRTSIQVTFQVLNDNGDVRIWMTEWVRFCLLQRMR